MEFTSTKAEINKGKLNPKAVAEINKAETLLRRSEELLRTCQPQVGMVLGEEIGEFLSTFNDQKFNSKEYHHERLPDGQ